MLPCGVLRRNWAMRIARVARGVGGRGAGRREASRVNKWRVDVDLREELLQVLVERLGLWTDMPVVVRATRALDPLDAASVALRVRGKVRVGNCQPATTTLHVPSASAVPMLSRSWRPEEQGRFVSFSLARAVRK